MRMQTYSRLWRAERKLYTLGDDKALPVPVGHRAALWTLIAVGVFFPLMWLAGIDFTHRPGLIAHILLPYLLVRWVLTQTGQGARPADLIRSWGKHLLQFRLSRNPPAGEFSLSRNWRVRTRARSPR